MVKSSDIRTFTQCGRPENSFLIRTLETEPNTEILTAGNSYAVLEQRTGNWLFSLSEEGDFTRLAKKIDSPLKTFYVNGMDYREEIEEMFPNAYLAEYKQYILKSDEFVPDPAAINPNVRVERIDKRWVDFILSIYKSKEFARRDYTEKCIETNPGFIAFLNGKPVGYILIHLNGELGSMTITEDARGQGVGNTLMQYITPVYASLAGICIGFVLPENIPSRRMLERACYEALDDSILWVYN